MRDDKLGAVSRYRAAHYAGPALIPTMAQLPASPPSPPTITTVRRQPDGSATVTWRPGAGEATMFAVYRVDAGQQKAILVGTVRGGEHAEHSWTDRAPSTTDGSEYCVSGLDRLWNEGRVSSPLRL